jgi:RNase P subunit RPR2
MEGCRKFYGDNQRSRETSEEADAVLHVICDCGNKWRRDMLGEDLTI